MTDWPAVCQPDVALGAKAREGGAAGGGDGRPDRDAERLVRALHVAGLVRGPVGHGVRAEGREHHARPGAVARGAVDLVLGPGQPAGDARRGVARRQRDGRGVDQRHAEVVVGRGRRDRVDVDPARRVRGLGAEAVLGVVPDLVGALRAHGDRRGGAGGGAPRRTAVLAGVDGEPRAAAGGGVDGHRLRARLPAADRVGREGRVGRRARRWGRGDRRTEGLVGLHVAGVVGRAVGDVVGAGMQHDRGPGGVRRGAVDLVLGLGHSGGRIRRGERDRGWVGERHREVVVARGRLDRVDVDVAGAVHGLRGQGVDAVVLDAVRALVDDVHVHAEVEGSAPVGPAVLRVVDHPGGAVAGRAGQRHRLRGVLPAARGAGREAVRGRRGRDARGVGLQAHVRVGRRGGEVCPGGAVGAVVALAGSGAGRAGVVRDGALVGERPGPAGRGELDRDAEARPARQRGAAGHGHGVVTHVRQGAGGELGQARARRALPHLVGGVGREGVEAHGVQHGVRGGGVHVGAPGGDACAVASVAGHAQRVVLVDAAVIGRRLGRLERVHVVRVGVARLGVLTAEARVVVGDVEVAA